jgi:hypothetical protein
MMGATLAKVSTLLMSVGQPHRPLSAGEGRTRTRGTRGALRWRHERGFLAADKGAGADADVEVEVEGRLEDAAAEQAELLGLADRVLQPLDRERVLRADVDVTLIGADGVAGDGHALPGRGADRSPARCGP